MDHEPTYEPILLDSTEPLDHGVYFIPNLGGDPFSAGDEITFIMGARGCGKSWFGRDLVTGNTVIVKESLMEKIEAQIQAVLVERDRFEAKRAEEKVLKKKALKPKPFYRPKERW